MQAKKSIELSKADELTQETPAHIELKSPRGTYLVYLSSQYVVLPY